MECSSLQPSSLGRSISATRLDLPGFLHKDNRNFISMQKSRGTLFQCKSLKFAKRNRCEYTISNCRAVKKALGARGFCVQVHFSPSPDARNGPVFCTNEMLCTNYVRHTIRRPVQNVFSGLQSANKLCSTNILHMYYSIKEESDLGSRFRKNFGRPPSRLHFWVSLNSRYRNMFCHCRICCSQIGWVGKHEMIEIEICWWHALFDANWRKTHEGRDDTQENSIYPSQTIITNKKHAHNANRRHAKVAEEEELQRFG